MQFASEISATLKTEIENAAIVTNDKNHLDYFDSLYKNSSNKLPLIYFSSQEFSNLKNEDPDSSLFDFFLNDRISWLNVNFKEVWWNSPLNSKDPISDFYIWMYFDPQEFKKLTNDQKLNLLTRKKKRYQKKRRIKSIM